MAAWQPEAVQGCLQSIYACKISAVRGTTSLWVHQHSGHIHSTSGLPHAHTILRSSLPTSVRLSCSILLQQLAFDFNVFVMLHRWHQVLATLLAILCCFGGFLANAVFVDDLYLFGATTEDKRIQGVDDEVSPTPEITLPIPFVLYDRAFRNAFVSLLLSCSYYVIMDFIQINNNGAVTFESNTDSSFTYIILPGASIPIIAPYWADVDTTNNGTLWYRLSNETSLLERFKQKIFRLYLHYVHYSP